MQKPQAGVFVSSELHSKRKRRGGEQLAASVSKTMCPAAASGHQEGRKPLPRRDIVSLEDAHPRGIRATFGRTSAHIRATFGRTSAHIRGNPRASAGSRGRSCRMPRLFCIANTSIYSIWTFCEGQEMSSELTPYILLRDKEER